MEEQVLFLPDGDGFLPTEWPAGSTRGQLSDLDGPFGACAVTPLFERRA